MSRDELLKAFKAEISSNEIMAYVGDPKHATTSYRLYDVEEDEEGNLLLSLIGGTGKVGGGAC